MKPFENDNIAERFTRFENEAFALKLREFIFDTCEQLGYGEVEESLKWSEPSYVVAQGTAVRIGEPSPKIIGLYVNCRTTIIDDLRSRFPKLSYDKTRGLLLDPNEDIQKGAVELVSAAMMYKRKKKEKK